MHLTGPHSGASDFPEVIDIPLIAGGENGYGGVHDMNRLGNSHFEQLNKLIANKKAVIGEILSIARDC